MNQEFFYLYSHFTLSVLIHVPPHTETFEPSPSLSAVTFGEARKGQLLTIICCYMALVQFN